MEIDQDDLDLDSTKEKIEKVEPEVVATPGQVTSLRRLGGGRGGEGEKKKRGWGASRTSRLSSSENIEITSNSLKDIVPDIAPLLSTDVAIEEEPEKNGKNGIDSDDDMCPTLPKEKLLELEEKKIIQRKRIKMEDDPAESNIIIVYNLARPFTEHQFKEVLKRTGTVQDFWINKIKSKSCVKFATVDQASETRMALNGVTWPMDNKNPLIVTFGTEEEMLKFKNSVEEPVRIVTSNGAKGDREWDREKVDREDRRRRERSATPEKTMPTKSLEELFNKTKALPAVYWKPLSEETIRKKEEARKRRAMASQKKKSRSRS